MIFKHLAKTRRNVGTKIFKNPGISLEIAANIGTAATSKNLRMRAETALGTMKSVHQRKSVYLN